MSGGQRVERRGGIRVERRGEGRRVSGLDERREGLRMVGMARAAVATAYSNPHSHAHHRAQRAAGQPLQRGSRRGDRAGAGQRDDCRGCISRQVSQWQEGRVQQYEDALGDSRGHTDMRVG